MHARLATAGFVTLVFGGALWTTHHLLNLCNRIAKTSWKSAISTPCFCSALDPPIIEAPVCWLMHCAQSFAQGSKERGRMVFIHSARQPKIHMYEQTRNYTEPSMNQFLLDSTKTMSVF